jgi:hypothetical protein
MRWVLLGWLAFGPGLAIADTPAPAAKAKPAAVPYRLTDTMHVLVRAKLNGKGPFNFILDTGAPAVFITTKVAEQIGAKTDPKGWAALDRCVLEGGLNIDKAQVRVEDLFQLEGMNGMGLAGAPIHGVIGYNVIARYRIEYDFTRDKLVWHPLDFEPLAVPIMGKGGAPGGLDAMGSIMKLFGTLMGGQANLQSRLRGFVGVELEAGKPVVERVIADSPADRAGLKPGDRLIGIDDQKIQTGGQLREQLRKRLPGDKLKLAIDRDGKTIETTLQLGEGL